MTAVKAMYETLRVLAPERALRACDIKNELSSQLEAFLENVDDLHKQRIQYLLKKIYDSTAPEVYAEALLEHVQFLKKFKGGNNGS